MQSTETALAGTVVRTAARAHERDRYLAALLSPRSSRGDLIALAAFAGEIGRIPPFVSEPMMGRIRLQWWRERIEQRTSGGHPIAAAMIDVIGRYQLDETLLYGLIDAHEESLGDRPFTDDTDLFAYVDRIDGALFSLAAAIVKVQADPMLIRDAGRAYGLARVLLELPATLAHGRLLLPSSRIDAPGTPELQIMQQPIREISAIARRHLAASDDAMRTRSRNSRSPFLPLALVEPYLAACENNNIERRGEPEIDPLRRVWRLWRCHRTGRVSPARSMAG